MNQWENLNKPIYSRLGKMMTHGGSSVVYELDQNQVAKEKLSTYGRDIIRNKNITKSLLEEVRQKEIDISKEEKELIHKDLIEKQAKLLNNIKLCNKYLGDYFLKSDVVLQENQNNFPTIYILQEKIPKGVKFLHSTKGFRMGDESRNQLRIMIDSIEKMYEETGLMIDLLVLDNVGFSEKNKKFYLFDIDPLICNMNRYDELKNNYEVGTEIDHEFVTATDQKTNDPLEVNLDHLEELRSILDTEEH